MMDKKVVRFLSRIDGVKEAMKNGLDAYAFIACKLFDMPYEDCLEWKDGKPYVEGQARRKLAKTIITLMYESRHYPKHINSGMEFLRDVITNYHYKANLKG